MTTLPTPRALLTSIINTLTTPPPPPQTQGQNNPLSQVNEPYDQPSNALKTLSPAHRALLSTMHVLFTPPMLLQALDLLDRGLVLRVVEEVPRGVTASEARDVNEDVAHISGAAGRRGEVSSPQANSHLPSTPSRSHHHPPPTSEPITRTRTRTTLHQVRSSQPPKSRFRDASSSSSLIGGTSSNIYTVRLEAWNCSCAAFAFASFPAVGVYPSRNAWDLDLNPNLTAEQGYGGDDVRMGGSGFTLGSGLGAAGQRAVGEEKGSERGREREGESERGREREGERQEEEKEEWEFGGMSMDGREGGGVPCCKHLLACVLGERWDVLGGYVRERVVGREEMAGLGCEG